MTSQEHKKMKTTQLCYASKRIESEYTLLEDLRDILVQAREYNNKNNICGVLYYAHGYYFQCIQGSFTSIMTLYNKILNDNRHGEIKLVQHKSIEKKCFEEWSMKYVQPDTKLNNFFIRADINCFEPSNIPEKVIDEFLDIILQNSKSNTKTHTNTKNQTSKQGFMSTGYSGYF